MREHEAQFQTPTLPPKASGVTTASADLRFVNRLELAGDWGDLLAEDAGLWPGKERRPRWRPLRRSSFRCRRRCRSSRSAAFRSSWSLARVPIHKSRAQLTTAGRAREPGLHRERIHGDSRREMAPSRTCSRPEGSATRGAVQHDAAWTTPDVRGVALRRQAGPHCGARICVRAKWTEPCVDTTEDRHASKLLMHYCSQSR